ncbi:glutamine amidotransferase [Beijerinckia indica]|uniref:Glutamine amidotransferase class-I n=1 Tax=Beijerinckia indica subsp. indica (strain ATCC 9039 / DSM 1715 / NCIMB 8712) TaxID=395963 RepID=B2ID38_BEII9|nr:glutamine amidotransferase [Beijerinckia indica]ACB96803.1 glutamine amidotransferase class-I [Beijerinckia indica subsp. indica ATCC 9039]
MEATQENPSKILVVLHQQHSTPGRIGRLLECQGYQLDLRRPRFGDPLPDTMRDYAAAIIFGGPMSANDEEDWLKREIDWIGVPLKENKPYLGICLGAQMLARHLGQTVCPHPQGKVEAGYYRIHPTEQGHELCDCRFPETVYQWHREGFCLPKGATLLAKGVDFEAQAFRYGERAYGLQFHPEVTISIMCRWLARSKMRLRQPNARPPHRHFQDWCLHDWRIARWSDAFLRTWIAEDSAIAA